MKKQEPGRFPTGASLGERADIAPAGTSNGFAGTELLARTVTHTPPNEPRIRGLGR
jgi:hypothetical protein